MATRPDDRAVHGVGAAQPKPKPKPFKPSPQAQAWAAPRSIFIPDALVPAPKKARPNAPYKGLPKPDHAALVQAGLQQAQERRAISLGALKIKDAQQPVQRQVTDAVPTAEDVARARLASARKQIGGGFDLGHLVQQGLQKVYGSHILPTVDLHLDEGGLAQRPDFGLATPAQAADTIRYGMGQELRGTNYLGDVAGNVANRAVTGLAATGYLAGQIANDVIYGNGGGIAGPQAQKAGYDAAGLSAAAHGAGQFAQNLVGGTAKGFLGFGPGLVEMALDPVTFATNMKTQYRDAYIDLLHGDEAAFWDKFKKNPSQYLFDMFAAASAFGKIGSMAGLIKDPGRVGYLEVDGGRMQRYTSPNLVSRLIENQWVKLRQKYPDVPVLGAKAGIKANMRLWRERGLDREMGTLAELQQSSKWFRGRGDIPRARNTAFDVFAHYGEKAATSIHDEIGFFRDQLALAKASPKSRFRGLTIRRIQYQIRSLENAIPLIENPPPELQRAVELARTASNEATSTRVAAGVLTPQAAANAPSARLRMVTPAEEIAASPVRDLLIKQIRESLPPELQDAAIRLHDAQVQSLARIQGRSPADVYNERWGGIIEDPRFLMEHPPPVGGELFQRHQETADPQIQQYYRNAAQRLLRAHRGALPENAQTVGRLQKLLVKLRDRAIEAEMARFWYETSARAILRHAGGDVHEATLLAKLIAIYSPRAEVWDRTNWNNTTRALGAYDEFKRTGTISDKWSLSKNPDGARVNKEGVPLADWQTENAIRTMKGEGDWEGLKTNSFYSNFLKWIDPAAHAREFGVGHVTIDTWMRRAFEYLKGNKEQRAQQLRGEEPTRGVKKDGTPRALGETITDPMYAFMRDAVNDIAAELGNTIKLKVGARDAQQMRAELGWEPEAVQAAIWTSIKGEVEGTPISTAGMDFGYALDSERTRHLARQRIDEYMNERQAAPNPYEHVIGEPTPQEMLDTFIADQARETMGGASQAQIAKTIDQMKYLSPDDPIRRTYEELHDRALVNQTPDPEAFFQLAEQARAGDFRVISADEAARMVPRAGYVYHGSDFMDSILENRQINAMPDGRMGWEHVGDHPNMAWLTDDPRYAAMYGKEVIEIPKSSLPEGTQKTRFGPQSYFTQNDVLFSRDDFHEAAAEQLAAHDALARDIASMFPPEQWREVAGGDNWVANNLRRQGLLDENGNYLGKAPDTIPEDWLAQMGPDLEQAVKDTATADGGFTLTPDLRTDDLSGGGYMISRPEYEGVFKAGQMTPEDVASFAHQHAAEISGPYARVGGWHNPRDGQVYLDISDVHHVSREDAIRIGREQGQESILDREAAHRGDWEHAFIDTGLTAEEAQAIKYRAKLALLNQKIKRSPFDTGRDPGDPMARVRGMVMFDENGKAYQWLNPEIAGLSTVRHEDIHAFRRQLSRDAEAGLPRAAEILSKLEEMVGVKNGVWKRKEEERLAKLFEDELHSGVTQQPQLKEAYSLARTEMSGVRYSKLWKQLDESQRVLLRELVDPNHGLFAEGSFYVKDTVGSPAMRALKSLPRGIRKPKKRNKRNLGVLFTTGRIRRGPRVVLEDAAESKRMKVQLTTIDDIVNEWGKPFEPELRQGLLDGYSILNRDGVKIPRSFLHEALDDPEIHPRVIADAIQNDEREMLDNIFMSEERLAELPPGFKNLVQVPTWVKDEIMYGNLKLNGGGNDVLNMIGGLFDSYNNLNRLAGIYLKPAYTTVNFTSNTLIAALKQGVFLPLNLAYASGVLGDLSKATLRMLDEEVGSGGSIAISGEGKGALGTVTDAVAHAQNFLADRLMRRTAIIHELRKNGVIGLRPSAADEAAIRDFLTNPKHRELRNVVGMDAENSMVRFRGLAPVEKQVISRAIYVYPWIKGAYRYSVRLPWDMPVRASVVSHIGQEGWDWTERELGKLASFMRSKSPLAKVRADGTVPVIDPNSLTAQSSAGDVLGALLKTVEGAKGAPDFTRTLSSLFTPSLSLITGQATGTNDIGRETGNILEAFGSDVPQVGAGSFAMGMIRGGLPTSKYYKSGGRTEVLGRFFLGALYPRQLNVAEANKAGLKQLPTIERWKANMKAGKAGYTAADVQQKILRKQAKEIEKVDPVKGDTYKLVTALIAASKNPQLAGDVDGSLEGINAEIKDLNEVRVEAKLEPLPLLTPETYAQYEQAVADSEAVTHG